MPPLARRIFAEGLGTAFLLAAVVGSGIMAQKLAGGNVALALLCNTIPTGAILVVLILVFGPLSGAHFNPAVSVAFVLRRELPWSIAVGYIAAQIMGAVAGVWVAHLMFELPVWQFSITQRAGTGQWLAEAVATFGLLSLTILAAPARTYPQPFLTLSVFISRRHTGSPPRRRSPTPPSPSRVRSPTHSRASLRPE